jgi:hypothetical protein
MLNAIGTVHWKKGFFNYAGGYEFNLAILTTAVAITAIGPGRYSTDHLLGWAGAISGPRWTLAVAGLAALVAVVTLTIGPRTALDHAMKNRPLHRPAAGTGKRSPLPERRTRAQGRSERHDNRNDLV